MKKQKKKKLIMLTTILIVLVLALLGVFLHDRIQGAMTTAYLNEIVYEFHGRTK